MRCLLAGMVFLFPISLMAEEIPEDWAFKPIMGKPTPPRVRNSYRVFNPIDAFLLTKLEAQKLSYSDSAEKLSLLRRVTFDLIGLPPTAQEIAAFLKDDSADAYEKVVDRLLASPQFGERAALYWLDLVRFAETDGFKADDRRPHAWRYRDYVIRSFNQDKPYDRFLQEQLAGDELFPNDPEALIATGFLRHYPDEYNAVNLEQRRQEILNDITDTTGQVVLGLTISCARCHDHKFDPITQMDYYRMQAFFVGWKEVEIPLLSKEKRDEYEAQKKAWEEKTAELRQTIEELEKPYRLKAIKQRRGRFPEEYAAILDIPAEQRTPLQKQIVTMVEKQVYANDKNQFNSMKAEEKKRWEDLKKQLADLGPPPVTPPMIMGMTDVGTEVPKTHLLKRGNWRNPAKEAIPGFLSMIDNKNAEVSIPESGQTTGRRTALAKWLTSTDNPLTARVAVNRLWQQHFGKGLVASSGDFGSQGDRPTHPELLDWLAQQLIANNWSLKKMHRLMVTSAAYQQVSLHDDAAAKVDPDNRLLWRQNRRRLDGEALRDTLLLVSGQLNFKMEGPSVFPELPAEIKPNGWTVSTDAKERNRRSIYVFVKRNLRYPLFQAFDAPDRNETCSRRYITTTAPQALMLMNEKLILNQAKQLAERIQKEVGTETDQVIDQAIYLTLQRQASSEEKQTLSAFVKQRQEKEGRSDQAIVDLCHALMNVNEFIYVD